jgi:hypothetical protein
MTDANLLLRLTAALKLIYPDEITPTGKRILEKIIESETSHLK